MQFKFKARVSAASKESLLNDLKEAGANRVEQLFPGERDAELKDLYVCEGKDDDTAAHLLGLLQKSASVEFAEGEIKRRLIR